MKWMEKRIPCIAGMCQRKILSLRVEDNGRGITEKNLKVFLQVKKKATQALIKLE